jgi:hypothetical protein
MSSRSGRILPGHAYSAPVHIFLGFDNDKRARDRFSEIGGIDPDMVNRAVFGLDRYEFLYIRKADIAGGPYQCIVGA